MSNQQNPDQVTRSGYTVSHNTHLNWKMDSYHFHEFFEVNFALSDDISFFVAEQVYQVKKGTLLVFNDMDLHRSVSPPDQPYERYVLHFSPNYVQGLSTESTNLLDCFVNRRPEFSHSAQLGESQSARLLELLSKAADHESSQEFGSDVYRKIVLAEMLLYINQLFRTSTVTRPAHVAKELQRILPIIDYIQSHLADPLCLDLLSCTFYIDKYHLGHLFKQATGFTLNEYIIHRRILRARELLKLNHPVHRVGEDVGFANNSHFIRTFKGLVGTTPKQYQLSSRLEQARARLF